MRAPAGAATLLAACILAGCGAVQEGRVAGAETSPAVDTVAEELLPAPPIEAIDEPATKEMLARLVFPEDDLLPGEGDICLTFDPSDEEPHPAEDDCDEEDVREIRALLLQTLPAAGTTPRAVARLGLRSGGAAYFIEYESRGGAPCGYVYVQDADGASGSSAEAGVPCFAELDGYCRDVCLGGSPELVTGTVSAAADGLRLRLEDGQVARYPLTGPTLPSDAGKRIFMAELERGVFRKAELLEGDEVIYSQEFPSLTGVLTEAENETGVDFMLDGDRLTVSIAEDAPPDGEQLLDRDVTFLCGTADEVGPYGASALLEGRFPPGEREVTVTLSRDLGDDVYFCGVEAKDGTAEAFSFDVGL